MSENPLPPTLESSAERPSVSATAGLRRELWKLSRGRRLILGSFAACIAIAAAYNYGSRPLYQSTSVISLDEAGAATLKARGAVDQSRRAGALAKQVLFLRSRGLALKVVRGADPSIGRELAQGPLGDWRERISEEVLLRLGFPRRHGTEWPQLVDAFLSRLSVEYTPPEAWVYVRLTGYDPDATALALNRLISLYLDETARETAGATGTSKEQLDRKLLERQGRVVETMGKLQAFEQEQGLQNLTVRRDLLRQEIARLQDSLLSVRQTLQTRRANAEESLRLPIAELITIPSVRNDGEVIGETRRIAELEARMAQLTSTFGDLHPEVAALRSELEFARKTMNARLITLREGMARDLRASLRDERDIAAAVQSAQENLARLDRSSTQHDFIQKEAEAGKVAVGELIARKVRENDEEVFLAPVVLQRAEPATVAESPRRARNFEMAALVGLLLGLSLALLRTHLDETLKTPEEVKSALGLPLMGMVPRVADSKFDLFAPEQADSAQLFEAYRVLRTNLTAGETRGRGLALITSSREAEGKTTSSSGLAVSLALAGHRVLLIDGDLRRTSVSRLLSATDRWGLTDAVEGRDLDLCIWPTAVPGLSLLPAGTPRPNPAEILTRERLDGVVARLRESFEWIVCDAPPLLAVADAAILCRLADSILVVIGANSTPLGSVRAALDQLAAVGVNVRGVVLNNIDLSLDSRYYRHYYSAQYGNYSRVSETRPNPEVTIQSAGPRRG